MKLQISTLFGGDQEIDGQEILDNLNRVTFPTGRFMTLVDQLSEEMEKISKIQEGEKP